MFQKSKSMKLLTLLIAVLLTFAACGPADGGTSSGGSSDEENSEQAQEPQGDPDELVIGFWAQSGVPADYQEVMTRSMRS